MIMHMTVTNVGMRVCGYHTRWKLRIGHSGRLIGISWKLGPPNRVIWVSMYENNRPCNNGSSDTSIPTPSFHHARTRMHHYKPYRAVHVR